MNSYEDLHKEILGLVYAIIMGLFGAVAKMISGDTRKSLIKDLLKESVISVFTSVIIFFSFYQTDKKGILFSCLGIAGFMSRQILDTINRLGSFMSSIKSDFIVRLIFKNFFPNVEIPEEIPVYSDDTTKITDKTDTSYTQSIDTQSIDTQSIITTDLNNNDNNDTKIKQSKENMHKLFEIRNRKRYERLKYIKKRIDDKNNNN